VQGAQKTFDLYKGISYINNIAHVGQLVRVNGLKIRKVSVRVRPWAPILTMEYMMPHPHKNRPRKGRRKVGSAKRKSRRNKGKKRSKK